MLKLILKQQLLLLILQVSFINLFDLDFSLQKYHEDPLHIKNSHMYIDLPSLYGEDWGEKLKSNGSVHFNKHFNPKKKKKGNEHITFNDLEQIKSIAFVEKNPVNENFCIRIFYITYSKKINYDS